MFKNLAKILSWISVVGVCTAMEKADKGIEVENPIPLLIQEVAPNFLQGDHYMAVCESFGKKTSQFQEKCLKTMNLPEFPEQLKESWQEKLDLLTNTYASLSEYVSNKCIKSDYLKYSEENYHKLLKKMEHVYREKQIVAMAGYKSQQNAARDLRVMKGSNYPHKMMRWEKLLMHQKEIISCYAY